MCCFVIGMVNNGKYFKKPRKITPLYEENK